MQQPFISRILSKSHCTGPRSKNQLGSFLPLQGDQPPFSETLFDVETASALPSAAAVLPARWNAPQVK